MPAPELPTWQDCHELWSKQRRRQQREQDIQKKYNYGDMKPDGDFKQNESSNQSDSSFKSESYKNDFKPAEASQEAVGQVK